MKLFCFKNGMKIARAVTSSETCKQNQSLKSTKKIKLEYYSPISRGVINEQMLNLYKHVKLN